MAEETINERQEVERIIREELEAASLDEGFLQRVMSRAQGETSALRQLGKNVGTIYQAIAQGKSGQLKNPKVVKAVETGVRRLQGYEKKFAKVLADMTNDLELMFGENFESAPDQLKNVFRGLDDASTTFAQQLSDLTKQAQSVLTGGQGTTQLGSTGDNELAQGLRSKAAIGGKMTENKKRRKK